jgi:hypothetical protein
MALPQIPRVDREQAITDMIEALALQEAAVAGLIYAEAGKVDALVAAGIPAAENTEAANGYQAAVADVLRVAAEKQQTVVTKLEMLRAMINDMKQKE